MWGLGIGMTGGEERFLLGTEDVGTTSDSVYCSITN